MESVQKFPWETYKEELRRLFLAEDKSLSDVMVYMENEHNFRGSKAQYERYFKKWKFRKNFKDSEWKFVHYRVEKRKRGCKASNVYIDGILIPRRKVMRETSRHNFQAIQERFGQALSPKTPEGFYVCTPPSTSGNTHLLYNLPWFQLQGSILPKGIPYIDLAATSSLLVSCMSDDMKSANESGILTSALTTWTENSSTNQIKLARDLHSHLRLTVPEQGDRSLHPHNTTGYNLIKTDVNPQILCLVLYLMSNNMMKEGGAREVVEYFKHNSGKRFLRLALGIKASTIEAFAERLFVTAIQSEDIEIVHILLSYGVDPSRWSHLYTPLICVVREGNSELAQLLIRFGADVNGPPDKCDGQTALQAAAEKGNIELVRILLDAGANVNGPLANGCNRTVLQRAAADGNIELVRILLDAGADINAPPARHIDGLTALQAAVRKGNIELVRILLDAGADVNGPPAYEHGRTALQMAAEEGNIELLRILLDAGADVNARPAEDSGATALQICVIHGFFEIAMVLLDAGADVNAPGSCIEGRTALEGAAENGRIDIVQWLLNAGADVTGSRAPQLALSQGYYAVKKIIESHSMVEAIET